MGEARTKFLKAQDRDPAVIATAVGLNVQVGQSFRCVLPAAAADGVARVDVRRHGSAMYRCDCHEITDRSLTEVFAVRVSGGFKRRSKVEFVLWKVRLCLEADVLAWPDVQLPEIGAPPDHVRLVYEGLRVYVAARLLASGPGEFEFTRTFASSWCGIGNTDAGYEAIKHLIRGGVLVKVGERPDCERAPHRYVIGPMTMEVAA